MQQFFAILRDSFREAVDGFVIYLMLGLSALLLVLLGSISYAPDPPDRALETVLQKFAIIFPDKGESNTPTAASTRLKYNAANAEQAADGSIAFTLVLNYNVKKATENEKEKAKEIPPPKPVKPQIDEFRYSVFTWLQPAGQRVKNPFGERGRGAAKGPAALEFVTPPAPTDEGLKAVTDEQMIAFLKYQFVTFVGVNESDIAIARKAEVAEPEYKFDVKFKRVAGASGWPHSIYVLFGAVPPIKNIPLGTALYVINDVIVNGIGAAVTLILSVVMTAFFIPNMLRKGSLDLLISKPIGRVQLLVYKYIGGLTFIFLLSSFTIGGVWLVMALRSGLWDPRFLLVIPVLTFSFAILYAVSTVVAVFTRSAIAAILVTLGFMFAMYLLGQIKSFFDMNKVVNQVELPEWSYTLVETIHNILPRYKDLDKLTSKLIVDGVMPPGDARLQGLFTDYPSWGGAISVSLAFIALMLALASWRLAKRDG